MAWIVGIDEAGYGPNLGPFVMTAVMCRVPDDCGLVCLWEHLAAVARRCRDGRDDRLVVDDSKAVYASGRGLIGLERGVHVVLPEAPLHLAALVDQLCPVDHADLAAEVWYSGTTPLPTAATADDLHRLRERYHTHCGEQAVTPWHVRSVVVCPGRFNALTARANSKAAVVAEGFSRLLRWVYDQAGPGETVNLMSDKQGGRNAYARLIEDALPAGFVWVVEESAARSSYRVQTPDRRLELAFQPRADAESFCVAMASMVSKYVRELFMAEFNGFWQRHVPELKPTAGYPVDARRFLEAIRPVLDQLQVPVETIWRAR
ncbi:MAG: hypothetical protein U0736_23380 [Gemmataceae bacterium]